MTEREQIVWMGYQLHREPEDGLHFPTKGVGREALYKIPWVLVGSEICRSKHHLEEHGLFLGGVCVCVCDYLK